MPQTIPGRALNTLKLAADDVATVKYAGGGSARILTILNHGPGKVMLSNDSDITPGFDSVDCLLLSPGIVYSSSPTSGALSLLLVADVADTVVSFSFL